MHNFAPDAYNFFVIGVISTLNLHLLCIDRPDSVESVSLSKFPSADHKAATFQMKGIASRDVGHVISESSCSCFISITSFSSAFVFHKETIHMKLNPFGFCVDVFY